MKRNVRKNIIFYSGSVGLTLLLLLFFLYVILPGVMSTFAWHIPGNYKYIASEYIADRKYNKAEEILLKAAEERPWDYRPCAMLGKDYELMGNPVKAKTEYLAAVEIAFTDTTFPRMMNREHRRDLADLYEKCADITGAAKHPNRELFFYTYAAILDPGRAERLSEIFRNLPADNFIAQSETRKFYMSTGMKLPKSLFYLKPLVQHNFRSVEDDSGKPLKGTSWRALRCFEPIKNSGLSRKKNGELIFLRNASVNYELTAVHAGNKNVYVSAAGTDAFGISPILEIKVNGKFAEYLYVQSGDQKIFPVRLTLQKGENTIMLSFKNDGALPRLNSEGHENKLLEDRNLVIKGLFVQ